MAQAHKKAFYVAAESFKFTRLYPLNQVRRVSFPIATACYPLLNGHCTSAQTDLPVPLCPTDTLAFTTETLPDVVEVAAPAVDYTPPRYISLLLTDLGVLTPSAISDELIKLYY